MPSIDIIERHAHWARSVERFFRVRLAEAQDDAAKKQALNGLRNAVAARKQLEAWPSSSSQRVRSDRESNTPREHRSALTWPSTAHQTSS